MDTMAVKAALQDGREIALLDVREQGQFGESHLFFGIPLPYSRLEVDAARLLPCKATRIVVYDDGALGVAQRAARRLQEIGYANVHVLDGGTAAWAAAGLPLYKGVNVPSKTFGELVEHACHTPRVSAQELERMQREGEPHVLLDGRPLSEFAKMSIPGATCCPNGELPYRVRELAPDPATPIVVNCAGRTRSIIGAQILIDLGIPNPVYALENGTQGWYLSDFKLDHGAKRRYPEVPRERDFTDARGKARALAERNAVAFIDDATAQRWLDDPGHTSYLLDVRTAEEFAERTLAGAVHAPGGQLLQATDQWVAVRHARIVLFDSDGVRAPVIAAWLRRMGHDACVLEHGLESQVHATTAPVSLPPIEYANGVGDALVVDVRPSMAYRKGHVAGSIWSIRPRFDALALRMRGRPVVVVADEDGIARIAAHDFMQLGAASVKRLRGGQLTERTPGDPPDADCIDYLFFVHDRHDGNKQAARDYLAWETQLLSQLHPMERAAYRLPA